MESIEPDLNGLENLQRRARDTRARYDELNVERGRTPWDATAFMLGFVTDVGALAKLVMARERLREAPDLNDRIAHELADCLWSVMILADECGVDLEPAFLTTMSELETRLDREFRKDSSS